MVSVEMSHPSRVRGLKLVSPNQYVNEAKVAPFTGAWIETMIPQSIAPKIRGRTLHGCVD